MPGTGAKGTPKVLNPRPPDPPRFAVASLWVLLVLSGVFRLLFGLLNSIVQHGGHRGEDLFLMALGIVPVLCVAAIVGLKKARPWGWWIGMGAFGIPLILGALFLISFEDPHGRPVAILFFIWLLPGISLWGRRHDLLP